MTLDPAMLPTAADARAVVLALLIVRTWEATHPGRPCPLKFAQNASYGIPWLVAYGPDAALLRPIAAAASHALDPDRGAVRVFENPDPGLARGFEAAALEAFQRALRAEIVAGVTSPYALMGTDLVQALGVLAGHFDPAVAASDPRAAARQMVLRWAANALDCPEYLRGGVCDGWFGSNDPADGPAVRGAVARHLGDRFYHRLEVARQHVRREEGTLRSAQRRLADTWHRDERSRLAKRIRATERRLRVRRADLDRWVRAVASPKLAGRDAHTGLLREIRHARLQREAADAKRREKELAREKAAIRKQRAADARREAWEARRQANASAATTPAPAHTAPPRHPGRPRAKGGPHPTTARDTLAEIEAERKRARAARGFQQRLRTAMRAIRRGVPHPPWPDVEAALSLDRVVAEAEATVRAHRAWRAARHAEALAADSHALDA